MKPLVNFIAVVAVTIATAFFCCALGWASPVETVYVTGPRSSKISITKTEQGQLLIPVKIGGRLLDFLLDTGSPTTCVDSATARELGFDREVSNERRVAIGGAIVADASGHSDLTIGGLWVHRCPIHITDMSSTREAIRRAGFRDFQGVIGIDLLLFLRGRVDFGRLSLELRRP